MRFTVPLFAACVGQVISLCAFVCLFVIECVCLCERMSQQERMEKHEGGSAVLMLAGWWGGRCQKASLDSREEAANSSSLGSLSDLNTNTDVLLILV